MSDILYSTEHLWFKAEEKGIRVGIADYLKNRVTPAFIQMPDIGTVLESGKPAGVMESTKFACEITIPFACKVTERNEQLFADPELLVRQQESQNWLCAVEVTDDQWKSELMDSEEYESYIEP